MSLVMMILEELCRTTLNYKGVKTNLFGIPKFNSFSDRKISDTLAYLKGKKLINYDGGFYRINKRGREYIKRKIDSLKQFNVCFEKNAPKNLLVMYDVPENKKAEREWLRWHLKKFNYRMIQKSVWVGPSPLPKEFLDYLDKIKIKDGFKTFKLAKGYEFGKK